MESSASAHGQPPAAVVLAGGGEMGALMRTIDWSATPIGPVERWPQSLRTVLSVCLDSRFPILLWWGPELVMLYNDAYRPMLGSVKHPAALGQRGRDCWPEIWEIIGPMLSGVLDAGQATWSDDQLLVLDRNGFPEECYFTFSYSPIRDESGQVGGVFTAVTETTPRVLAERRLQTLRDLGALASEARHPAEAGIQAVRLLAANPMDIPFVVLYLLAADGHEVQRIALSGLDDDSAAAPMLVDLDSAVAAPTGWPLAEVIAGGQSVLVADLSSRFGTLPGSYWPEPSHAALVLPLAIPGQDRPAGVLVAGLSPRRPDDTEYRGFLSLVAGQIAAAVATAVAYEEERRRAEALAELDRAKTVFFNNVSHEFRTPLTLMLGPAADALADAEQPLPPEQRARVELVQRNGVRLLKLVNTLLDFSRIEAGRVRAMYEPIDLAVYTAELSSVFRAAAERAGLQLLVDCPPLSDPVYVDREMWEKVVLNLLSNAVKFTLAGEIAVIVRENLKSGTVTLTVRDTGVGIPEAELPHVFERFHRVPQTRGRTQEGSGIGLALVQELIRLHGGAIAVSSAPDAGATFTVSLPLGMAHLPADQVGSPRAATSAVFNAAPYVEEALRWLPDEETPDGVAARDADTLISASALFPGFSASSDPAVIPHVLLADDNADMRDYVRRLLGRRYTVETVADGHSALAAARDHVPDLVLSDIMMPGLDGFGLLRALREDPRTRAVPVVLLSARAGEESRVDGMEAGADDYLVKPFSARELLARVGAHIELARVRAEATHREQALRAEAELARQRFYDLFMQAPAFICVLEGPEHRFAFVNTLYQELLGPRPLVGLPVRIAVPEVAGQGYYELLDSVFRTGEPFVGLESPLRLDRTRTGTLEDSHVTFVYQPTHGADGEITGVFVHGIDVTDQVRSRRDVERLAEENARLYREAQEALKERDAFVGAVSHDLKTPLTTIGGMAELLQRRITRLQPAADARIDEGFATIRSATRTMTAMVGELLDLSRLQSGQRLELDRRPVDLVALVRDCLTTMQGAARRHTVTLETTVDELDGLWDSVRLERVIANLLSNAIKYSPAGTRIAVTLGQEGARAIMTVTDQGMGIPPPADLPHIFERFYRGSNVVGQIAGTGIGLAGAHHIVEQHGGTISVTSNADLGTRFEVRLPLADADA